MPTASVFTIFVMSQSSKNIHREVIENAIFVGLLRTEIWLQRQRDLFTLPLYSVSN